MRSVPMKAYELMRSIGTKGKGFVGKTPKIINVDVALRKCAQLWIGIGLS